MATTPPEGLKSLATSTGLSVSTISRVLNGKAEASRISASTRQRVLDEAARQGIVINAIARGLRLRSTQTLGLVIPDISNPFFASLARQVERASRVRGYSVLLCDSQENTGVEAENIRLMLSRRVDGMIVAPVGGATAHLEALRNKGKPLVLMDRVLPDINTPGVAADNAGGATLAVDHLAARGHRHIGCIQGLPASSANAARVSGYRAALAAHGIKARESWICGQDYTLESARKATEKLLRVHPEITALLALGNMIALGVLQAARSLSRQVPDELSLVSFDDQPWAEWVSPPLTTIAQPVEDLGSRAMDLFFRQVDRSPAAPGDVERVILPMSLIERGSVSIRG